MRGHCVAANYRAKFPTTCGTHLAELSIWRKDMQAFKTILCPVDFSEFSQRAIRYAAAFAQQNHARLIVYHCVPSAMALSGFPEGIPVGWQDWNSRVTDQMENVLSLCKLYNIDVSSKIETGDASSGILNTAKEVDADLIVMGTHGLSGYEAILMGSVTNKVVHKSTVPVLAVCKATKTVLSGDPDQPLLIGKILCAVDPDQRTIANVEPGYVPCPLQPIHDFLPDCW